MPKLNCTSIVTDIQGCLIKVAVDGADETVDGIANIGVLYDVGWFLDNVLYKRATHSIGFM
jgi:hypothetical protein